MNESCDHKLTQNNFGEWNKTWEFCPHCGVPLKETALDRVLWLAVNKPNPGGLFPSQSLEHAVLFFKEFKLSKKEPGSSFFSLDFVENGYWNVEKQENKSVWEWEVSLRGQEFASKDQSKAITKALLWITTELSKETVEDLIKEEN